MSGGKQTLKGSMYSSIYISLILWLVLSTREAERYMMEQRKRDMQGERTSEGVVRTLLRFPYLKSNLPIGPTEGGRYEQKSEMRVRMPLIDSHVNPCDKFF